MASIPFEPPRRTAAGFSLLITLFQSSSINTIPRQPSLSSGVRSVRRPRSSGLRQQATWERAVMRTAGKAEGWREGSWMDSFPLRPPPPVGAAVCCGVLARGDARCSGRVPVWPSLLRRVETNQILHRVGHPHTYRRVSRCEPTRTVRRKFPALLGLRGATRIGTT